MHLNNRARDLLDKYSAGMAQQFGARDTSRYFSLNDPQENALRLALLESVEFLNMITCLDVDQLWGWMNSWPCWGNFSGRWERKPAAPMKDL